MSTGFMILCAPYATGLTLSVSRAVVTAYNQTTQAPDGTLRGTRSLPLAGRGFHSHSVLANALGRQHAHHAVIESLVSASASVYEERGTVLQIAEIGWPSGGRFLPHRTHREGLSVDILTPMRDRHTGEPARLGSSAWNLYGYCWHVDDATHAVTGLAWDASPVVLQPNRWLGADVGPDLPPISIRACPTLSVPSALEVDFEATAAMLEALDRAARERGGKIRKVIVDPSFVDRLHPLDLPITSQAWIDHDDHIHIDFSFPTPPTVSSR